MDFGIWLPNRLPPGEGPLEYYTKVAREAERLGYKYVSAGENLQTLDIATLLTAVCTATSAVRLVTAILLLPHRGPVLSAKFLASLDRFSQGRVIAGIGAGSAYRDYRAVGLDSSDMWPRFDEATEALRALLTPNSKPFSGRYYSTEGVDLGIYPVQTRLPLWIGSWGSKAGLRRVARHGDGWLSSSGPGHHTPNQFRTDREVLNGFLREEGRDSTNFPLVCSSVRLFISENKAEIDRVPSQFGHQIVGRDWGPARPPVREEDSPHAHSMVGSRAECMEKVRRWKQSGARAIFVSPSYENAIGQMRIFMEDVVAKA